MFCYKLAERGGALMCVIDVVLMRVLVYTTLYEPRARLHNNTRASSGIVRPTGIINGHPVGAHL